MQRTDPKFAAQQCNILLLFVFFVYAMLVIESLQLVGSSTVGLLYS